jgi:hypothetical protein
MNRDASLFRVGQGSGPFGRRASAGRAGCSRSAGRRLGSFGGVPAWHSPGCSRSAPGRNSCRCSPDYGNRHTGTDGQRAARPVRPRRRGVDERHHWQDTRSAFVPGTVWGTAPMQNRQVERGAVLTPNPDRLLPRRLRPRCSSLRHPRRSSVSNAPPPSPSGDRPVYPSRT